MVYLTIKEKIGVIAKNSDRMRIFKNLVKNVNNTRT